MPATAMANVEPAPVEAPTAAPLPDDPKEQTTTQQAPAAERLPDEIIEQYGNLPV